MSEKETDRLTDRTGSAVTKAKLDLELNRLTDTQTEKNKHESECESASK